MKRRVWEITVINHDDEPMPFRFFAEDKELAHDHAMTLRYDPTFYQVMVSDNVNEKVRAIGVRFVGWASEDDNLEDL